MWNKIKNLFKRKKVKVVIPKPKMDFGDVEFELNIKSICYYEKLTGTSFYEFNENNLIELLYSIYLINNPDKPMTLDVFRLLLDREEIAVFFLKKFADCSEVIKQIIEKQDDSNSSKGGDDEIKTITDYITTLIIEYGMDANYVMYKMGIWELKPLFEAIETKVKKDMVNQRFWTFMNVMPHIDTKKVKTPDDFIPFEWGKSNKKERKHKELDNNVIAAKNLFGSNILGNVNKNE